MYINKEGKYSLFSNNFVYINIYIYDIGFVFYIDIYYHIIISVSLTYALNLYVSVDVQ